MTKIDRRVRGLDPETRRIFSYLDGELRSGELVEFEREIASNPGLKAEVRTFRSVLAALDQLAVFAPSPDFRLRVLVALYAGRSWRARLRAWIGGGSFAIVPNAFGSFLDESLTTRQARALSALVARDPEAAAALAEWKRLHDELGRLPAYAPTAGFRDRVMARVDTAPAASARHSGLTQRIRRAWPRPADRLAAASGIAFGPTTAVLATAYMLFSNNPLVTASNVASFLWTKTTDVLSGLINGGFGSAAGNVFGILDGVAPRGPAIAVSVFVFACLTLMSAWILYRNIVKVPVSERRYVPI